MDDQTVQTYNEQAAEFAARHRAIQPDSLHELILGFFHRGAPTADIGCGSGRDVAWLEGNGFPTIGYDASSGMLQEARATFSHCEFREDALPALSTVSPDSYTNVLCLAVVMHLPREDLIGAALSLARITRRGGRLILHFRPSQSDEERELDGRLFTAISPDKLALLLESVGFRIIRTRSQEDANRPGVTWHTIAAEKSPLDATHGSDHVQGTVAQVGRT